MTDLPKLTPVAQRVLLSSSVISQEADAADSHAPLLLALIEDDDSAASHYLETSGVTRNEVAGVVSLGANRVSSFDPENVRSLSVGTAVVVARAQSLAAALGHSFAGTEHLLIALVEQHNETPDDHLRKVANFPHDPVAVRRHFFGG